MFQRILILLLVIAAVSLPAANARAAKCNDKASAGVRQLGAGTVVALADTGPFAAGKSFRIAWRRGEIKGRFAAYLMVAFDGPVRFAGKGFYALLPGAEAAFQIGKFGERTRAVVPYYPRGAAKEGEIEVVALEAGTLQVEWAVVGHDGCKEIVAQGGSGSAEIRVVATGTPEIVVNQDALAGEEPKQRIYSPAGNRVIEVHDGRYRLIDAAGRSEIADRAGNSPRFSPTGRYLAAYAEEGIEILDTVDGKTVYRNSIGRDLAWDNADSFAVLDRGAWGTVAILAPSHAEPEVIWGHGACHVCGGTDSTALRIDLENNVAVYSGALGIGAKSLTTEARLVPDHWSPSFGIEQARAKVTAFVKQHSQVRRFVLPKVWELRGGLKFSNLAGEADRYGRNDPLLKFLVQPITEPRNAEQAALADGAVKVAQWRGLSLVERSALNRNMLKRLAEFGLPIAETAAGGFAREALTLSQDIEGVHDDAERATIRRVVEQIKQEVPGAAKAFGDQANATACYPDSFNYQAKRYETIVAYFQRAFRFQRRGQTIWITHYRCLEGSMAASSPSVAIFDAASGIPWILGPETGTAGAYGGTEGFCFVRITDCLFDAQIYGDNLLMLSSRASRAIEILDLATRRNVFKKYNLPRGDLLDRALISPDGKLVLALNTDGSFSGFRLSDAVQLFEGRYVDDEVVVWAPDGRFDATSEGAHYVSLRVPGRVGTYTFEQFSARLRTPGLVQKLLVGEAFAPVALVSPPSLSGAFQAKDGRILGAAEASGDTPVSSLLVFQDGLLTDRLAKAGGSSVALDFGLLPGARWVSLVAVDEAGLASLPMGRDLPAPQTSPRRVHVLAVGVDNYDDAAIPDLGLARSDAERFAQAIGAIGGDVTVASSVVLDEKMATRDGVLMTLRAVIAKAGPGETVVLFFAGHGVRSAEGAYFLATPDTRIGDIKGSALPWDEIAAALTEKQARIAVFLDTCHSGAAETGAFSTNDAAAENLLERIPSGIVVFSASKGRELSEESASVGGGVFTSALVDVIAAQRVRFDANRNGAIEISELYRGVKAQVKATTNGRQTPWIARNQMVGDFALF